MPFYSNLSLDQERILNFIWLLGIFTVCFMNFYRTNSTSSSLNLDKSVTASWKYLGYINSILQENFDLSKADTANSIVKSNYNVYFNAIDLKNSYMNQGDTEKGHRFSSSFLNFLKIIYLF